MTFLGLVVANALVLYANGFPSRLGAVATIIEKSKTVQVMQDGKRCHDWSFDSHCIFEVKYAKYNVWLVGDSHAEVLGDEVFRFSKKTVLGIGKLLSAVVCILRMSPEI